MVARRLLMSSDSGAGAAASRDAQRLPSRSAVDREAEFALISLARLHASGMNAVRSGDATGLLRDTLEAVMGLSGADFGSAHVVDPDTKRLTVASYQGRLHGLVVLCDPDGDPDGVTQTALRHGGTVIVDDVESSTLLGEATRAGLISGDARAIHSVTTPAAGGEALGVMSIFFCKPRRLTDAQAEVVGVLVRHAADFLEHGRAHRALEARCAFEREARLRAESACSHKDEFLAVLSHELRQPLAATLPAIEVQKHGESPEHRQKAMTIIEEQLRQLTRLVEDLTDLSHINRGTFQLRKHRIDLRSILRQAVDMTRAQFESKRHD